VMILDEAAKHRILTKGDGYLYNYLQPVQGALLAAWKDMSFSTMKDQDLTAKIQKIEDTSPFKKWVSGDYKGATDTLTRAISIMSTSGLPDVLKDAAVRSLAPGGKIVYPAVKTPEKVVLQKGFTCIQKEGQLMGHVLSFPLLCVINLAVYRLALKRYAERAWDDADEWEIRKKIEISERDNVIINGDDIAFKADDELYDCFVEVSKEVGFVLSKGKNFFSRDTVQINSQVFHIVDGKVNRIGYLNQKMVYGVSLKGGGESSATPVDLGKELGKMVGLCKKSACTIPLAMSRFEHKYGNLRPNWYLPVHLGGYGIPVELNPKGEVYTRDQRIFAAMCVGKTQGLYRAPKPSCPIELGNIRREYTMVPDPYVPEAFELETRDEWQERKMYMEKCLTYGEGTPAILDAENVRSRAYIKLNRRYKPMTLDRMRDYYEPRWVGSRGTKCPPLNYLYIRPKKE